MPKRFISCSVSFTRQQHHYTSTFLSFIKVLCKRHIVVMHIRTYWFTGVRNMYRYWRILALVSTFFQVILLDLYARHCPLYLLYLRIKKFEFKYRNTVSEWTILYKTKRMFPVVFLVSIKMLFVLIQKLVI